MTSIENAIARILQGYAGDGADADPGDNAVLATTLVADMAKAGMVVDYQRSRVIRRFAVAGCLQEHQQQVDGTCLCGFDQPEFIFHQAHMVMTALERVAAIPPGTEVHIGRLQ